MGTFYRTIRMLENGIKPVYVFDGKPPEMKSDELTKRTERRDEVHFLCIVKDVVESFSYRLRKRTPLLWRRAMWKRSTSSRDDW